MTQVLGRTGDRGISGHLGNYRTRDGSAGASVRIDIDSPHVGLVVGKRGYGKSYTLGVLVEELVNAEGVTPVVADPMGAFTTFSKVSGFEIVSNPRVSADALSPRAWCDFLGLDHEGSTGSLLWRAATESSTLADMDDFISDADANRATRRSARNHLALAEFWNVFSPDGITAEQCVEPESGIVLDCSRQDRDALADARPAYMRRSFGDRMPETPGSAVVVDDATESVHSVQILTRRVEHGGRSPSAIDIGADDMDSTASELRKG